MGVDTTVATPPVILNEKSLTVNDPVWAAVLYTVSLKVTAIESFVYGICIPVIYGTTSSLSVTVLFDWEAAIAFPYSSYIGDELDGSTVTCSEPSGTVPLKFYPSVYTFEDSLIDEGTESTVAVPPEYDKTKLLTVKLPEPPLVL